MTNPIKRITAVLGPTNTGKSHLAVETMMEYESGILIQNVHLQKQILHILLKIYIYYYHIKKMFTLIKAFINNRFSLLTWCTPCSGKFYYKIFIS